MLDSWQQQGPLARSAVDKTIELVQDRLDLLAVLRHRYGQDVSSSGERWRTACFLPSLVANFDGSCAEQDATENSGEVPKNLWVSEGDTTLVWRCHSCKRRGDVIDLIEHADGLPRTTQMISLRAVRTAAKLAGVTWAMDERPPSEDDEPEELLASTEPRESKPRNVATVPRSLAAKLNVHAANFWHARLLSPTGMKARDALHARGITDEQIERYRLGYAPAQWRALTSTLRKDIRHTAAVLGLLGTSREGNLYDRQRGRLMFPYVDLAHEDRPAIVSGFAGRKLDNAAKSPKWLNSTNVQNVWEKRSQLFGLFQAAERAREVERLVVVEGAGDVLAYDRVDVPAAALVSAELTEHHARVIVHVLGVRRVLLALDGDESGRKGALRAATTLLRYGLRYEDITLTDPGDDKDPETRTEDLRESWENPDSVEDFALRFG